MAAGTGSKDPKTGVSPSLLADIKWYSDKGLNAAEAPKTFKKLIDMVDHLQDPNVPSRSKDAYIYYLFGPKNIGLISQIERDGTNPATGERTNGKFSVYNKLYSPGISAIVAKQAELNPDIMGVYKSTGLQLFAKELLPDALRQMNELNTPGYGLRGNIHWDSDNSQYVTKDKSNAYQTTVDRINQGLVSVKNIFRAENPKATPQEMNSFVLGVLQDQKAINPEMMTGLPQEMYDALSTQKAHAKKEKERLENDYKTLPPEPRKNKDTSRVTKPTPEPTPAPAPKPEPEEDLFTIPQQSGTGTGTLNPPRRNPF